MKYLRTYESLSKPPKVGDYVLIDYKTLSNKNIIGQIDDISSNYYYIQFVDEYSKYTLNDLEFWSDNKEDLEILVNAKRYNV